MLIVVDTNVVICTYLVPNGTTAGVLDVAESGACGLLVSPAVLSEYERVLRYPHLRDIHRKSDAEIVLIINRLSRMATHVTPMQQLRVVQNDPDDDKFVECAVEGNASYIISGDKHLLALGSYQNIQVLSPAAFLRLFDTVAP